LPLAATPQPAHKLQASVLRRADRLSRVHTSILGPQ
jgi:hypothetical protein